jgi:modulator of FtsH protease
MRHIPAVDSAYDPAAWHDFGVALVGASAALLGLVFVVVSLHLGPVVDDPVLRRRAEIMLGLLATTLAASAALLIPGQSREALGIELMAIALTYISLSGLATFHATRSVQGVSRDRLARFFLGELSAGLIFAGGLGLLVHALGGAYLWQRASSSGCSARCSRSGSSSSASVRAAGRLRAARLAWDE